MADEDKVVPFSARLRRYIDEQDWQRAWSYEATWPHEYVLRAKTSEPWLFHKVVDHIRAHGVEGRFWKRKQVYFTEAGLVYWEMGRGEKANIINRCLVKDTFEYRLKHAPETLFARKRKRAPPGPWLSFMGHPKPEPPEPPIIFDFTED